MADKISTWVDSELCTGCGLCVEAVPEVFAHDTGGLCKVRIGKQLASGPEGLAVVPEALHANVIAAAEECPGECIFVEIE